MIWGLRVITVLCCRSYNDVTHNYLPFLIKFMEILLILVLFIYLLTFFISFLTYFCMSLIQVIINIKI